jgi:ribosomal protein S18 acetylase RimI-like enzyme
MREPLGRKPMTICKQTEYSIRPATEADYPYCYRLIKRNMFDLFCHHWGGWGRGAFRKGFDAETVSMVIVNNRRAGYFCLKRIQEGLYLDNIQLSPSIQGRGVGTAILKDILREHSSEMILLTTFSDNPAKHLYERLGFALTERKGATLRMTKFPKQPNKALQRTPTSVAAEL